MEKDSNMRCFYRIADMKNKMTQAELDSPVTYGDLFIFLNSLIYNIEPNLDNKQNVIINQINLINKFYNDITKIRNNVQDSDITAIQMTLRKYLGYDAERYYLDQYGKCIDDFNTEGLDEEM